MQAIQQENKHRVPLALAKIVKMSIRNKDNKRDSWR